MLTRSRAVASGLVVVLSLTGCSVASSLSAAESTPPPNPAKFTQEVQAFSDGLDERGLGDAVCEDLEQGTNPMNVVNGLMNVIEADQQTRWDAMDAAIFLSASVKYLCPSQRAGVLEMADEMGWPDSTKALFDYP